MYTRLFSDMLSNHKQNIAQDAGWAGLMIHWPVTSAVPGTTPQYTALHSKMQVS